MSGVFPIDRSEIPVGCRAMLLVSGCIFLAFTAVYGLLAAVIIFQMESMYPGSISWRETALDTAFEVVNFTNALVASVLSTWVLAAGLDATERYNVMGRKPSTLAVDLTLGSVCGYIVVEALTLYVSSYRLSTWSWTRVKESFRGMVVFHAVSLVGLLSVVIRDAGYPLAIWVVWSELTSVFIGLDSFIFSCNDMCSIPVRAWLMFVVRTCAGVLFVVQRVVLFYYLLWLCWSQFVWELGFVFQLAILVIGTLLNTRMAVSYITELLTSTCTESV